MPIFIPPVVYDDSPFTVENEEKRDDGYALMKFFKPRQRGVNIYILSNGALAQDVPTPENRNTQYPPYPLLPDQSKPNIIATSWGIPGTPSAYQEADINPYVVGIYLGAHIYEVTAKEALILATYTAFGIGYAGCITAADTYADFEEAFNTYADFGEQLDYSQLNGEAGTYDALDVLFPVYSDFDASSLYASYLALEALFTGGE